ncbi:APC family permease [Streptacidiphilus sp. EB103A]|uniref:APC family permease n=1 Tax=Streptacidiphilus sp. EB103A TaxID=3156275 RepID=UPI0035139006
MPEATSGAAAPSVDVEALAETDAATIERAKLRRHLGRVDVLLFLLCTLIGLDTIGSVASYGGQAITWLLVLVLVFYVPSALLISELAAAFPAEGGPYVWTRMAFGHLAGAVNNILYWVSNPVWLGGTLTITAVSTVQQFYLGGKSLGEIWFYLFALGFIWVGIVSAVLSMSLGKYVTSAGALVRVVLLSFFVVTVGIYAIKHGFHGIHAGDLRPSWAVFLALTPVLLFNFVGFDVPSSAAEEMQDPQRDVPIGILRGGIGAVLGYILPVVGILTVLPTSSVTGLTGFTDAMRAAFTVYGGHIAADGTVTLTGAGSVIADIVAAAFLLALLTSAVPWLMGSDRALAVSGYDGAAPRSLGVISARFGTPVRVNVLSGIVASTVCVLAHELSGSAAKYFAAVLALALSTTLLSYLGILPAALVLRRKLPEAERPYRVPGGKPVVVLCVVATVSLLLLGAITLIYPGFATDWLTGANVDDALPRGWAGQRGAYTLSQVIPLVGFLLLGVAFYFAGRRTRAAD